jgi:hypothetical protein
VSSRHTGATRNLPRPRSEWKSRANFEARWIGGVSEPKCVLRKDLAVETVCERNAENEFFVRVPSAIVVKVNTTGDLLLPTLPLRNGASGNAGHSSGRTRQQQQETQEDRSF